MGEGLFGQTQVLKDRCPGSGSWDCVGGDPCHRVHHVFIEYYFGWLLGA
jgi:hypothetical protein